MKYELIKNTLIIEELECFDLSKSCSCGQAFRWREKDDGSWVGMIKNNPVNVSRSGGGLRIRPCRESCIEDCLAYFDLERDYKAMEKLISDDPRLNICLPCAAGIRVFNQDPFEALISFIISANNNIKRISGIIERLCRLAGEKIGFDGEELYSFPSPERVAALSIEELRNIGAGYRAAYIRDSAKRIADGYELEKLRSMPLDSARKELLTFPGVGPKVADCILLFSLGHTDAFPVDVWIGRAMKELYFDSEQPTRAELKTTIESIGKYSGILQQYIFFYAREAGLGKRR